MEALISNREAIMATFFPGLPFCQLFVEAKGGMVKWELTFLDLGMCHTLKRSLRYREIGGQIMIGRHRPRDKQQILQMIFGHFQRFRRRLDRHLKVNTLT